MRIYSLESARISEDLDQGGGGKMGSWISSRLQFDTLSTFFVVYNIFVHFVSAPKFKNYSSCLVFH